MATYTDQFVVYDSGSIKKTSVGDVLELTGNLRIKDGAYDLDIESHDGANGLKLGGVLVSASAAELNKLDGVTATTEEINYLDISTLGTSEASRVVTADSSGDVILAGNLTVQGTTTTVSSTNTVVADKLLELGNGVTGTPSGDAGIIIERGDSNNAIIAWDESADRFVLGTTTATGASTGDLSITDANLAIDTLTFSSLNDSAITITGFVDEDNMASDSATLLPTQQSVKAYVDSQVTAQDLDFQGDSGGALSIDLDSETLTIAGGSGITTSGSANTLTVAIDSTVATLTDEQTLTGKTLTSPVLTTPQINDTSSDHQYVFAVSELTADRTVTLPLLTGNDEFVFAAHTQTLTNKTFDANGTGNSLSNVEVENFAGTAVVTESEGINSSDNDTSFPTTAAVKDYVDSQVSSGGSGNTHQNSITAVTADAITIGRILAITSNGVTAASSTNKEVVGVAKSAKNAATAGSVDVHTASGQTVSGVTVQSSPALASSVALGDVLYLSNAESGGKVTNEIPTSGIVYRLGYATGAESSSQVSMLWLPQFIADLG